MRKKHTHYFMTTPVENHSFSAVIPLYFIVTALMIHSLYEKFSALMRNETIDTEKGKLDFLLSMLIITYGGLVRIIQNAHTCSQSFPTKKSLTPKSNFPTPVPNNPNKTIVTPPQKSEINTESTSRKKPTLEKIIEKESPVTREEVEEEKSFVMNRKARFTRTPKEAPITKSALFCEEQSLPTEIKFTEELIYPSPNDAPSKVYPLPGAESKKPIARVFINGHFQLIHNTQFGVLTLGDELTDIERKKHNTAIETGNIKYAENSRLFKTHSLGACGNQRIHATTTTNLILKDGTKLTLHAFDHIERNAHPGK